MKRYRIVCTQHNEWSVQEEIASGEWMEAHRCVSETNEECYNEAVKWINENGI